MNPDTTTGFQLGYRRWLDGLRGIAILLVLANHLHILAGGSLGVDIFFVLSGFLITTLLIEEWQKKGCISLKRFYARRALRLFPALAVLLLACGIFSLFLVPDAARNLRKEMLVAACYIANWPDLHGVNMETLGHTWSLSVEEQFYLLWPPILLFMLWKKFTLRQILIAVCAGILASAILRMGLHHFHPKSGPERSVYIYKLYIGLHTRADSLLTGCLVGLLVSWNLLPKSPQFMKRISVAALVSAIVLAYLAWRRTLEHSQYYNGLFTAVAVGVGIIIIRLLNAPSRWASPILESVPLVGIGRISYALYLYHVPVIQWVDARSLGWKSPGKALLAVALTFAAATLSYFLVERPALRLKARLERTQSTLPPASTGAKM